MAKARVMSIKVDGPIVSFVKTATGESLLRCDSRDVHKNSELTIKLYGIKQSVADAGAQSAALSGKLQKMQQRWQNIVAGSYVAGTREASMPMRVVFEAAVTLKLIADTPEKREAWGKMSEPARLNFARRQDIQAEIAKLTTAAKDTSKELEDFLGVQEEGEGDEEEVSKEELDKLQAGLEALADAQVTGG